MPTPSPIKNIKPSIRKLAVEILNAVNGDKAFAEPILDQHLSHGGLKDDRDRRLLTEIVYGTLRMQGYLDWLIGQFYQRDLRGMDMPVLNILRSALYQRFFTERIPEFAIVNEAVELAKRDNPGRAALVNGVLRNVLRRHDTAPQPEGDPESPRSIAITFSHPEWLVKRWVSQLGVAETTALCRANNQIAPFCVRVNPLQADRESVIRILTEAGFSVRTATFSTMGLVIVKAPKPLREMPCYENGLLQIQDEASQMMALLIAPQPGEMILDLCAGIGGKSTQLAALMENQGRIVAVDISKQKIAAMETLVARLGVSIVEPLVADALGDLGERFRDRCDRVLVDVPCSGTGTLRRAPEIKWRLTARHVKEATLLQKRLIDRAAQYVRPGGRLVYSTCSVMAEENESVVADFLSAHGDFSLTRPQGIDEALLDDRGFFRSWPHRHGTDGFFGAVMMRQS